ncbi:hypothetical protein PSP20601_03122 [Pandoraea sputorum]|uniref:Uncharacterized protein n=1 Tax=Pandoraea sputorum TaxID=93222 RepID=A0A5E5BFX2_9BURK|nr:hypothetical protein PSP20601_03122 [Pandoraea sputorum]VVE83267.1 hypothetical protein PSP31121_04217 [Pandoraea sputorum]VVE84167.1 hypothetical protein PSP31120_04511 [Pandoraea sputorum]
MATLPQWRSRKLPTPVLPGSGAKGLSQPRDFFDVTTPITEHPCFARSHYNIDADARASWLPGRLHARRVSFFEISRP